MFNRLRLAAWVCALVCSGAKGQPPAPAPGPTVGKPAVASPLDQLAIDVLKDVHNLGAELYNRQDAAGAYRIYEGALLTVKPFLAHRPAIQKVIESGLAESAKADGVKVQAFRLHEVIEQVRAELKAEAAKTMPTGKGEGVPKVEGAPMPKPVEEGKPKSAPPASGGALGGKLTAGGMALKAVDVTVVSLDLPKPQVFTATTDAAGAYRFAGPLPAGKYAAMVTGPAVPPKYTSTATSPLRVEVSGATTTIDLNLQ